MAVDNECRRRGSGIDPFEDTESTWNPNTLPKPRRGSGIDPFEDTESTAGSTYGAITIEVAVASIRSRILKDSPPLVLATRTRRSGSGIDPFEDTESFAAELQWDPDPKWQWHRSVRGY